MKENDTTIHTEDSTNYDLKSEAVERLVQAQAGEAEEYSQEELNQYTTHKGFKIPDGVKIPFIKAWFAGAVCFFFLWGLGNYLNGMLDMLFVLAIALGMVTDLLVNNSLRFLEKTPGANDKWMLFPKKGMLSMVLNLVYSGVIVLCVYMTYNLINYAIISLTGVQDQVPLGVEPVLFGVLCMGYDILFIGIKRLLLGMLRDAKAAAAASDGRS